MADIFVDPVNGNDTRSGSSRANAVKTLTKGATKLTPGDRLVGMAGRHGPQASYGTSLGVSIPSNSTVYFEPGAVFDQEHKYPYHFLNGKGGSDNVVFDSLVLRNSGAAITFNGNNIEIKNCDIRETKSHCISINHPNDNVWIHHNYLENAQQVENYRSCISVFGSKNKGLPGMNTGDIAPNWNGLWGVVATDNVCVNTGYVDAKNGDGNGIIIDCQYDITGVQAFHDSTASGKKYTNYDKHTLVARNIVVGSAGCGIKVMMSRYNHVHRNTSHANKRNKGPIGNTDDRRDSWVGEFACYHIGHGFWTENIGYSLNDAGGVFVMAKGNGLERKDKSFVDNNVYSRNLLWNDVESARTRPNGSTGSIFFTSGSNPKPTTPPKVASPGIGGYFVAKPIFEDPKLQSNGKAVSAGNLTGIAAVNEFRRRYALKAGSPGIAAAADGGPIGAVRTGGTPDPDPDIEIDALSVMSILGDPIDNSNPASPVYPVGATVQFTAATFLNGPADTTTYSLQWWNGSSYEAKAATITGPSSEVYSTTAPEVTKKGGLRVKVEAVKGSVTVTGYSNWIDIAPRPISTETPPVNTVLPVISPSAPKVGSAATCPTGTWDGSTPMTFARQWRLDDVDIPGATSASYTPVPADKTKALTCKVTATNSEGSAFVVTAATSAVTDPVNLTLEEVTEQLLAAQGEIAAMRSDLAAETARNNDQDAAIAAIEARLSKRIADLETVTGGSHERLTTLEDDVRTLSLDLDDIRSSQGELLVEIGEDVDAFSTDLAKLLATGQVRVILKSNAT